MATLDDERAVARRHYVQTYLSPLESVKNFFQTLEELRSTSSNGATGNKRLPDVCEHVAATGEQLVLCLEQQIKSHNRASEAVQEISGVFRMGLYQLMQLRGECSELKTFIKDLQLAEHGLDARRFNNSTASVELQQKQRQQQDFVVPGGSPLPRAVSYEDFRKHRDLHLGSSKRSIDSKRSMDSSSNIRKAKSESDIAMQSLKKKVEGLSVDNTRLRSSEKKLLKQNIKLNRTCKTLEAERDRAEDRLKIEQTQRDSIEKLRQRNKELEDQLRTLCDTQVLREREKEEQREKEEEGPPQPQARERTEETT